MNSIDVKELEQWQAEGRTFFLIDVRETFEHEVFNIGGINIPLGELSSRLHQIPVNTDIVVYCAKGIRSVIAIQKLEAKGFIQLYNVSRGIQSLY